jgi:hypothetical protein
MGARREPALVIAIYDFRNVNVGVNAPWVGGHRQGNGQHGFLEWQAR